MNANTIVFYFFILFSTIIFRGKKKYWLLREKKITWAIFHEITSNLKKANWGEKNKITFVYQNYSPFWKVKTDIWSLPQILFISILETKTCLLFKNLNI